VIFVVVMEIWLMLFASSRCRDLAMFVVVMETAVSN